MAAVEDRIRDDSVGDGRTARRDRNRDAVLDAVLGLFSEDHLAPAASEVAARSGVSLRSVYRYYEDRDALVRAAIARNVEKSGPLFVVDRLGEGPLDERVERLVARRADLYEAMAPTMRAALRAERRNDLIRVQLGENRRRLLAQVEQMFGPELRPLPAAERREVAAALDVLLGFESFEHLRRHRDLSATATRRVLARSVRAQLSGAG